MNLRRRRRAERTRERMEDLTRFESPANQKFYFGNHRKVFRRVVSKSGPSLWWLVRGSFNDENRGRPTARNEPGPDWKRIWPFARVHRPRPVPSTHPPTVGIPPPDHHYRSPAELNVSAGQTVNLGFRMELRSDDWQTIKSNVRHVVRELWAREAYRSARPKNYHRGSDFMALKITEICAIIRLEKIIK